MDDRFEMLNMLQDLQSHVDSVVISIDNRLVLSTIGESVPMSPALLTSIRELLSTQNNIINKLYEENETILEKVVDVLNVSNTSSEPTS